MTKPDVYAQLNKARISSKKVLSILNIIRGKPLEEAKVALVFDRSKAAKLVYKVLRSAEANAKHNNKMDEKTLFVSEAWVGQGKPQRWGRIVGRGRFNPILKRTSHIFVGLGRKEK